MPSSATTPITETRPAGIVLEVDGLRIVLLRKPVKQVHLSINPPHGELRLSAPPHVPEEVLCAWIRLRRAWIVQQQTRMQAREREAEKQYIPLETHYVGGRACRLYITEHEGRTEINLNHDRLELRMRKGSTPAQREKAIDAWHRQLLRAQLPSLIAHYQQLLGVEVREVGIKRMKTRWGTCNPNAGRIWINAELAKKPLRCLEYIVAHEMVHLLEPGHNARFRQLLQQVLPDWEQRREELSELPVGV